jgi:CopY/TcrY family copper transport repressor
MIASAQISISESEWEIMRVVWANKSVTSRDVIDILEDQMNWKESTIKTLIGRLVEKEALEATKEGRKFIYSAKINEQDTIQHFSSDMLSRVCNKDKGDVIHHLVETAELSQSDIAKLMNLLEEKSFSAPEEVECACLPGQCDCHLI